MNIEMNVEMNVAMNVEMNVEILMMNINHNEFESSCPDSMSMS